MARMHVHSDARVLAAFSDLRETLLGDRSCIRCQVHGVTPERLRDLDTNGTTAPMCDPQRAPQTRESLIEFEEDLEQESVAIG
jgi:hypothetical protein